MSLTGKDGAEEIDIVGIDRDAVRRRKKIMTCEVSHHSCLLCTLTGWSQQRSEPKPHMAANDMSDPCFTALVKTCNSCNPSEIFKKCLHSCIIVLLRLFANCSSIADPAILIPKFDNGAKEHGKEIMHVIP